MYIGVSVRGIRHPAISSPPCLVYKPVASGIPLYSLCGVSLRFQILKGFLGFMVSSGFFADTWKREDIEGEDCRKITQ